MPHGVTIPKSSPKTTRDSFKMNRFHPNVFIRPNATGFVCRFKFLPCREPASPGFFEVLCNTAINFL
jgi:hypothetical protein